MESLNRFATISEYNAFNKRLCMFGLAFLLLMEGFAQDKSLIQEKKIYKQVMGQELAVDVFYTS